MASAGWPNWTALPSTSIVPPEGRLDPESTPNSSSCPWPFERDDAEHLAVMEIERDVVELGPDAEVADADARRAFDRCARSLAIALRDGMQILLDRRAEHQLHDPLLGARSHVDDADGLAVAQHRGAIAKRGNLQQPVRDEDHRAAGLALALHDVEHLLREIGRQRGRHLVEQQHVGLDRQRPREIEHAKDGERDVPRRLAEIEVGHAELLDPAPEGRDRRLGQPQIGGDVEIGDQRRLLIDRHQAGAAGLGGRMHLARFAADQDFSGSRPDGAGQDFHQRRLAGAVRAHQRVHLAGLHRQRGISQGGDRAVVLGDAGRLQEQWAGHCVTTIMPDRGSGPDAIEAVIVAA